MVGLRPSFSSQVCWCEPGAPVRFPQTWWGCPTTYVGERFVTWKMVGLSKPTYGFVPQAEVSELDGCPRFASAYLGRK